MWRPEPARQEHLAAEAVETFQVLYDTLGRPRGPRNVSRRACRSSRHSPREGHQRQFGRAAARIGWRGFLFLFRRIWFGVPRSDLGLGDGMPSGGDVTRSPWSSQGVV